MGVASEGDWGIGDSVEQSRRLVLIGIRGVRSGVRGAAEIAGDMAGTMFGEETILVLLGLCIVAWDFREASDIDRRRLSGEPPLISI